MPRLSGNYGQVMSGSSRIAEVGSWWLELTGGSLTLKDWSGSFNVTWDESRVLLQNLRSKVTLNLYSGDDDSEAINWTGAAFITSAPFGSSAGGTVNASFQGTGPLSIVENGEPRAL